jgi:hypothetical protein
MQRKSANCPKTTSPARHQRPRASPSERDASSRCTIRWSTPCDAIDRNVPPTTPVSSQLRVREARPRGAPPAASPPARRPRCRSIRRAPARAAPRAPRPAGEVDEELRHVHPDHRLEPPVVAVDQGEDADGQDGGPGGEPGDERQRDGGGVDAHPVGQRARDQEDERGEAARGGAEAALQQRVRRHQLAVEVAREQEAAMAMRPST